MVLGRRRGGKARDEDETDERSWHWISFVPHMYEG
jgi:hypothetical protein